MPTDCGLSLRTQKFTSLQLYFMDAQTLNAAVIEFIAVCKDLR